jgi:predicted nucleic acid-binding protein
LRWLLDTNVVSESVRRSPSTKVLNWVAIQSSSDIGISIVTLAELRIGAAIAREEAKRRELIEWIEDKVVRAFWERTLSLTTEILVDWLDLSRRLKAKGRTREPTDLLLAATARIHNLTIVSRNVRDFAGTGILVYDPWHDRTHRMELV